MKEFRVGTAALGCPVERTRRRPARLYVVPSDRRNSPALKKPKEMRMHRVPWKSGAFSAA